MLNVKSNYGTNKGSEELCQVLFLAQLQGFFALWNTLRFSLCASACLGFCSVEIVAFQNSRSLKKKNNYVGFPFFFFAFLFSSCILGSFK